MLFALPESYAAYATQKDVRAAVDHILNSKSLEVPSDLEWNQLPDLHAAVLAAHQVRSEYASALQRLWQEVWQASLDECGFEAEACSITEQQGLLGYCVDTKSIWEDRQFVRSFRNRRFGIELAVTLDINKAQLWMWFGDEVYENGDSERLLQSATDWYVEEDEGDELFYGWTKKELAPMSGGNVELDRLNIAAAQALERMTEIVAS